MRDIARALDIQGASLYAHVASKEEVLWAIVDGMATRFEAAAAAVSTATVTDHPAEALDRLVRAHVNVVIEDIARASVFIHEWRALSNERRDAIARRRDAYEGRFRTTIEAGVGSGAFAATDPIAASAFILTALNGLVGWYRPGGRVDGPHIADAYAQLALGAVHATGAEPR